MVTPRKQRAAAPAPPRRSAADPQWTITLAKGTDVAQAARALHAAGLQVSDSLEFIGVINGSAPARLLPRLRAVSGVADVAPLLGFDIGPPSGELA